MEFTHYVELPTKKAKRRYTIIGLVNDDAPNTLDIGLATCSEKDQYNRKRGLLIARGRAAKNPTGRFTTPNLGPINKENKRAYIEFFMDKAEEVALKEAAKR
jgi:hypothetical protein